MKLRFPVAVCAAFSLLLPVAIGRAADGKKLVDSAAAKQARWIWSAEKNVSDVLFRHTFQVAGEVKSAELAFSCDNVAEVFVNGKSIGSSSEWESPTRKDVTELLKRSRNVLGVDAGNQGGVAALLVVLVVETADGKQQVITTGDGWKAQRRTDNQSGSKWRTADFDDAAWVAAKPVAAYGEGPWKDVLSREPALPTDAAFHLLPGFEVDPLFTVPKEEMGSWVSITFDNKGRLIASDQQDKGLYRITPPPVGSTEPAKVEKLKVNLTSAQGMLYAFDALYVSINGGPGSGLYRTRDTDGDDQFDEVVRLREFRGSGEHGPHALRLSPDGKRIVVICGNHTKPTFDLKLNAEPQTMGGIRATPLHAELPEGSTSSVMPNWDEDLLLPRQWDANGHAAGVLAPGGWIASTDPEGKTWHVMSVGYRNPYDMDFNADGELFAYDADMEWDLGAPWYRPTRVVHATAGSEFGWRSGTGKWPTYYVDSLPQLVDVGPGSPVGVAFGYGTKFPAKYQRALYICDWTFGTMYAIHIEPDGASYRAVKEEFVSRTPLPLTDVEPGPDGCLYFTVGGRGTQSELFRVRYVGTDSTAAVDGHDAQFAELRALRRQIESHQRPIADGAEQAKAVEFLVPHLAHTDRHIRYAARTALEFLPVKLWRDRVLSSNDADTVILGAVATAHQGERADQPAVLAALDKLEYTPLDERRQLDLVRAYQLTFIRLGEPDDAARQAVLKKLDGLFPTASNGLNRELCTLLVALRSPTIIKKTLVEMQKPTNHEAPDMAPLLARNRGYGGAIAAMLANHPDLQQMSFAFALRNAKEGWTLDDRRAYFNWFEKARTWSGGNSFQGFLRNIDRDAYEGASEKERVMIDTLGARKPILPAVLPKPKGPGRDWKLPELVELSQSAMRGRNYENGRQAFAAARCVVCHRFAGEGGATGPDLTQLAGRFSAKDLLEATVDPNKVISDQYRAHVLETSDGKMIAGRVVSEVDGVLTIVTNPEDITKIVTVKRSDVESMQPSPVSLMPADLLKPLNRDEVLDLLAYLLSRGDKRAAVFRK